jgi:hypothetical protein
MWVQEENTRNFPLFPYFLTKAAELQWCSLYRSRVSWRPVCLTFQAQLPGLPRAEWGYTALGPRVSPPPYLPSVCGNVLQYGWV